jgi:hypothetical protein
VINENPGASRTVDYLVKAFVDGTDPRQLTRALGQHLRDITNEQDGPAWRLANEVAKLLEAEAEGHQPALVQ